MNVLKLVSVLLLGSLISCQMPSQVLPVGWVVYQVVNGNSVPTKFYCLLREPTSNGSTLGATESLTNGRSGAVYWISDPGLTHPSPSSVLAEIVYRDQSGNYRVYQVNDSDFTISEQVYPTSRTLTYSVRIDSSLPMETIQVPQNLALRLTLAGTDVNATWNKAVFDGANRRGLYYRLRYSDTPISFNAKIEFAEPDLERTNQTVRSLRANQTYWFAVIFGDPRMAFGILDQQISSTSANSLSEANSLQNTLVGTWRGDNGYSAPVEFTFSQDGRYSAKILDSSTTSAISDSTDSDSPLKKISVQSKDAATIITVDRQGTTSSRYMANIAVNGNRLSFSLYDSGNFWSQRYSLTKVQ